MKPSLILVSLFALAACADGMPTAMSGGSAEARFVSAVENNGCILNQANTARVLNQAQVTPEQVTEIVTKLAGEGKIETSMGASLRLTTPACS
ncbi:hypothetical protein [Yoonia sp.]|uniref:hypothetical protein n=1 Tax=Yoonia sp. TaxID=2212373 RepID=UPI0019EDFC6F|nr:hypothetical protein [Yoonia sp.]MBE0413185.1 hypothetical protein [Yoonia sp.]